MTESSKIVILGRLGIRRLAKNAIALAIGGLVAQIAFLFVEAYIARRLGQTTYGIFSTALQLRGIKLFLDMYEDPEYVRKLLSKVAEGYVARSKAWSKYVPGKPWQAIVYDHGMDMISIGPTLRYPHSPDEKILIPTIGMVWDFIGELLKELK